MKREDTLSKIKESIYSNNEHIYVIGCIATYFLDGVVHTHCCKKEIHTQKVKHGKTPFCEPYELGGILTTQHEDVTIIMGETITLDICIASNVYDPRYNFKMMSITNIELYDDYALLKSNECNRKVNYTSFKFMDGFNMLKNLKELLEE